jgi:hypothetical protein
MEDRTEAHPRPRIRVQPDMNRLLPLCLLSALSVSAFGQAAERGIQLRSPSVAEQYLQAAADQERAVANLPPLRRDPALVRAAYAHALRMAQSNTITHQFADEPDLTQRGAIAGARFSVISENVGEGPIPLSIQTAWMHSPHHRENILDPRVDSIGIVVIARGRQLFAVEDFARTVERLTLDQQEIAVAELVERSGVSIVSPNADARATCTLDSGYVGRQPLFVMRFTAADLNHLPSQLNSRLASGNYTEAAIGACAPTSASSFTAYNLAVLLYR